MNIRLSVVALCVLAIGIGGLLLWKPAVSVADIQIVPPNFVVHGKNLSRVEIYAVPTGTGVGEDDYQLLGSATASTTGNAQTWVLPIPQEPILATAIFARAYNAANKKVGDVYAPQSGATALYDALWGGKTTYTDTAYGISFTYPSHYAVEIHDESHAGLSHHAIVLVEKTAQVPKDSEGPPTISFDIYGGSIDAADIETWVRQSPASNFNLSGSLVGHTTLGGAPALSYQWSGLYEAQTIAAMHNNAVVAATVTYLSREDAIVSDYRDILSSLVLD